MVSTILNFKNMKYNKIKKCLFCALFALFANNLLAQYATELTITDINRSVAKKMEANASALLTELNQAFFDNRTPMLNKIIGLSRDGKSSILSMWETTPFRCIESEVIERGLSTPSEGWQVRNIPMYLKDMPEDDAYKEIAINFDRSGNIEDIYFTLELHSYYEIMNSENNEVYDLYRRQEILNFVENFRTAYNRKDIDLIANIYSDNAIIITGKIIRQTKSVENVMRNYGGISEEEIVYQVKTKKEYMDALNNVFQKNTRINLIFDDIEVQQHPKYKNVYGVGLLQGWNSTTYSDVGFLYLVIDFRDGDMKINVRTWQPDKLNGVPLTDEEKYKLHSFDLDN